MKLEIISEEGKAYLTIPLFNNDEKTEVLTEYEINVLEINSIKGIAKVTKKKLEGKTCLMFSLSGYISLVEKFERDYLNVDLFRVFFTELSQIKENIKSYLLDPSKICLKPEYIFYDEKEGRYIFIPIDEQENGIAEKYEKLLTFFADICSVDEKSLLEFIFESFSSLNENTFDEMAFLKGAICHKYEEQIVEEMVDFCEKEIFEEEEIEETPKTKGILIISGMLVVLAFWLTFMCREEFKYSVSGMAAILLAVGLTGYEISKNVIRKIKKKTT